MATPHDLTVDETADTVDSRIIRLLGELATMLADMDRAAWARSLRFDAERLRDGDPEAVPALRRYFSDEPRLMSVQLGDRDEQRRFESMVMRLHTLLDERDARRAWASDPRREVPGKTLGIVGSCSRSSVV